MYYYMGNPSKLPFVLVDSPKMGNLVNPVEMKESVCLSW